MPDSRIVMCGAGGHALVALDIVALEKKWRVVGLLDEAPEQRGKVVAGYPILGGLEAASASRLDGVTSAFIAIGSCSHRKRLAYALKRMGFELAVLKHPSAVASPSATVGDGSLLAAGSILGAGAVIGTNVIVNTGASVDHECEIGDGCHIGPGCRIGGKVHIGAGSWLGIGAVVRDRVRIGAGTLVGAGATVVSDLPDGVVAWGTPARIQRAIEPTF